MLRVGFCCGFCVFHVVSALAICIYALYLCKTNVSVYNMYVVWPSCIHLRYTQTHPYRVDLHMFIVRIQTNTALQVCFTPGMLLLGLDYIDDPIDKQRHEEVCMLCVCVCVGLVGGGCWRLFVYVCVSPRPRLCLCSCLGACMFVCLCLHVCVLRVCVFVCC